MSEQTPQELARAVLAPLEHDDWQTRSQKSVEMVKASKVLANTVIEQAEERKKWGKQVGLWQKLYYPLYGTLRGAQDFVDKPEKHEWLKRFIDESVKLMEAVGAGDMDFAAIETGDDELFNLLSEQNRLMNEEMLKQATEIDRLKLAVGKFAISELERGRANYPPSNTVEAIVENNALQEARAEIERLRAALSIDVIAKIVQEQVSEGLAKFDKYIADRPGLQEHLDKFSDSDKGLFREMLRRTLLHSIGDGLVRFKYGALGDGQKPAENDGVGGE